MPWVIEPDEDTAPVESPGFGAQAGGAITVSGGQLYAILYPARELPLGIDEIQALRPGLVQAIWLTAPVSELTVKAQGTSGLFKKGPKAPRRLPCRPTASTSGS